MSEKRRHARVPFGGAIEFSTDSDDHVLRMDGVGKDLSLGGMFIETETPCSLNEGIRIHLRLPSAPREIVVPAIVRWTRQNGMGVQFGLIGAVDTHMLTEFLHASRSAD